MADLQKIAVKLGKRPATVAVSRAPVKRGMGLSWEGLLRYPTATIVCFAAICSIFEIVVILSVLLFLVAASI